MSYYSGTTLSELLRKRQQLQQEIAGLEIGIHEKMVQESGKHYVELTSENMPGVIDENIKELKVLETMGMADISPTTYYSIRHKVDTVTIGKLKALLDVFGLRLYIGKAQS